MPTVPLTLPHHTYTVEIGSGLLQNLGALVRQAVPSVADGGRAALITDEGVEPHWAPAAASSLQAAGLDTVVAVMPVSEKKKTLGTYRNLVEVLLEARLERGHPVVTLGGGICGDVGGFVAATYLRGVPFVQVPTSLLAMVDASVGGKTGVNTPQGKNLLGAFHQPHLVVADVATLKTLPQRELRCGLAECIKHGFLADDSLVDWIAEHAQAILSLDTATLETLVRRNVQIKASVVAEDERESGRRAHLNLGHTFAHAIEAASKFGSAYKHGEAVALGLVAAADLSRRLGYTPPTTPARAVRTLEAVGLPTHATPQRPLAPTPLLMKAMRHDKKVRGGRLRFVLPTDPGVVEIIDGVPAEHVQAVWEALRQPPQASDRTD